MAEVYVFVQEGCPACTEFLPRVTAVSQPYRARGLAIYSVNMSRQQGLQLAEKMRVGATPTMIIVENGRKKGKAVVGAVGNVDIVAVLAAAAHP